MKTIELKAEGRCLNAALYEPACAAGEKYPLVLFLHGAGERGDDIEKVLDFTPGVDAFTAPAWQAEHPCFVLAPQCPAGQSWVPYIGLLARMLYALPREYAIDECRIYVTGVSMGGAGTWALLTACPQKIAAAMPVCGYAAPFAVRAARHVPVWAFHAADDPVVPVTGEYHSPHGAVGVGTRMAVSSLRSAGNRDVHYTEYPAGCMEKDWGVHPHASWAAAYRDGRALAWLFEKSRRGRYEAELICSGVFYIEDFNDDSMYLVEGREKALLIDTGLGSGDPLAFAKTLTALPVELAVTHAHLDHMRHSYRFERFYMSKKDLPLLPRVQDSFPENTSAPEQVVDIREGDVIDLGGVEIEVFELGATHPARSCSSTARTSASLPATRSACGCRCRWPCRSAPIGKTCCGSGKSSRSPGTTSLRFSAATAGRRAACTPASRMCRTATKSSRTCSRSARSCSRVKSKRSRTRSISASRPLRCPTKPPAWCIRNPSAAERSA